MEGGSLFVASIIQQTESSAFPVFLQNDHFIGFDRLFFTQNFLQV